MRIEAVDIGLVSATGDLADFYEHALGLERLEPRVLPFATIHRLACSMVTLKVMVPTEAPTRTPGTSPFWARDGLRYLTVWVDHLDSLQAGWVAAGGAVVMAPMQLRPGVRSAVLADPDGNVVEAMEGPQTA